MSCIRRVVQDGQKPRLALLPHLHLLVPDGVFFEGAERAIQFRALARPTVDHLAAVTAWIVRRMKRWLDRHEGVDEPRGLR